MSTLGIGPTYLDIASRLGPDNKVAAIIEMLAQTNEILKDMVVVEGNLPTGHKTTIRTGYPTVTWRLLNYGVQPSKSTTTQVTDTCGMLEAYAEIDKALADLNGNTAAFRLSEDRAFLEAMNQEMAQTLFYGNTATAQEEFMGLSPRYSGLNTSSTDIGYNVINGYSSHSGSDQTSVWLIVWGENTVHAIYPKGSVAGFQHQDLGEVTLTDSQSPAGRYQGYRTHYKWELGLCVRDWRYAVRVANLDTSAMSATVVGIIAGMIDAYYKVPSIGMGKAAFYCNSTVASWLHKQALESAKYGLTVDTVAGKPITSLLGIPIRRCDQILNTETEIS